MIHKIVIPGRFPSLNEWVEANRKRHGCWSAGNDMKQRDQREIRKHIPHGLKFKHRIFIEYNFFEPNTRRDKDNISGYFHKIFQDALVECGALEDDDWKHIRGMTDYFEVDKGNPRIEIFIEEKKT